MTGFIPNVAAGVFNYFYNKNEVIEPSNLDSLKAAFERIQLGINAACFPLGVLVFIIICRPALRALAAVRDGVELPAAVLAPARQKTLRLGWYGVWISLGFWLGASIVYPVCLTALVPDLPADLQQKLYFHFLASLFLCGLIAGSYPFFFGTALATGAFYPMLLRPGIEAAGDRDVLRRLDRGAVAHADVGRCGAIGRGGGAGRHWRTASIGSRRVVRTGIGRVGGRGDPGSSGAT